MEHFESFDAELNNVANNPKNWLVALQQIREKIDSSYNSGELAEYQWEVLVSKSANIQDKLYNQPTN